jgi:DNA-binding Lrp family transcriptional regulator
MSPSNRLFPSGRKSNANCFLLRYGGNSLSRFMASVNIFVDPLEKDRVISALSKLEIIKEVYEVVGEYDIVSVVSASCVEEFREVLHKQIMKIKGIRSTIITIFLEPHKGPKCSNNANIPKRE